ncbi:YdcF family protein [Neisseria sp. Ec49-e6-T10]|uniref:YdcF family protein n=1 Tax=Neisseria sp. Ec49-e6-T10 TaxID=3140744 RepID=UPI003EBAE902
MGIFLSVLGVVIFSLWLAWQIEQTAKLSADQTADAAIVLGAAAWGKNPSPVFKERIRHAVNLYQEEKVHTLIFTGGTRKEGFDTEAEVGKRYAMKLGIPERDIIVEEKSHNTVENLIFTKKEVADLDLNSFLIVSDPYHMYRAMLIAQDVGLNALPSPTPSSKFTQPKSQLKFLFNEVINSFAYWFSRFFDKFV